MPLHTYCCPKCGCVSTNLITLSELKEQMPSDMHPKCPECEAEQNWQPSAPGRIDVKGEY
jgi:hypothetical protein